jgi:uncharacterized membrane protein YoaT (DUF817 family)
MNDPTVPLNARMPQMTQAVLIVAMAVLACMSVAYAIRESRRRVDLVPVFLVIGCGLAVFYEPIGDALVRVFYTDRGQDTWIVAFGRHVPVFIGLLYFWYMPIGAYALLRAERRRLTQRAWWLRWGGFMAFAAVFEMTILTVGGTPWIYHGTQVFKVAHVPLLTPFIYISFVSAIGAGVSLLARYLPRSHQWLIVPAVPFLMLAGHAGTSLPLAVALSSNTHSHLAIAAGAIGSALLAVCLSQIASRAFIRPAPATRLEAKETVPERPRVAVGV